MFFKFIYLPLLLHPILEKVIKISNYIKIVVERGFVLFNKIFNKFKIILFNKIFNKFKINF